MKDLNPAKAAGIKNVPGKFLKDGTDVLTRPLSQLCNLSIKLNLFPGGCKIAKVKLLFKKDFKTDPYKLTAHFTNPHLIKIIERTIHDQNTRIFE